MKTYPEMNRQIVNLLRVGGENYELYAAARIEELEHQRDELLAALQRIAACPGDNSLVTAMAWAAEAIAKVDDEK